jgi:nucleotide-binding universal stress UspA family protein
MTSTARPVIVVGVTASPASAAALSWAADEARRRNAGLRVVHAWMQEGRAYYAEPISPLDRQQHEERARREVAATLHAVLGPDLPDYVRTEVREGMAERELPDASAGADLLVLGEPSGSFTGRSAGPVIRACLSHSRCPVVVVSPGMLPDPGRDPQQPAGVPESVAATR